MMTLSAYLELGTDPVSLAASALVADQRDHAMAATVVTIFDLATKMEESGSFLEMHVMRHAARWLRSETEAHRRVRDELIERSGYGAELAAFLKDRRSAAVATREASAPLFKLCGQYLRLALQRAGLDEAEALLASGEPLGVQVAGAVLDFLAANKSGGARG